MKVLVIAPTPFFADRGCHVRILEEVRALQSLGHHVAVCTYHIGRNIGEIDIRRSLHIPWYTKLTAGPSIHKFYADLFLLWTVLRACLSLQPQVLHAHLHEGVVVGKIASVLFGIPLVADLQGSLTEELSEHKFFPKGGVLSRIFLSIERLIVRLPDLTVTSSTRMRQWLQEHTRVDMDRVRVIIDGVDTRRFSPAAAGMGLVEPMGIPAGKKVVGYLGLLTDYQGVSVLLESVPAVVQRFPAVHFLIMGYPNVDLYRDKAAALGVREHVTFTGRIDYDQASNYLALCSLCVSPKMHTSEANGKLLNYMAMGMPVVASDTPVNREILGELGIYATAGDSKSLAEGIIKVLSDDRHAQDLGRRLRKRSEEVFSWDAIGRGIDESYHQVVGVAAEDGARSPLV